MEGLAKGIDSYLECGNVRKRRYVLSDEKME